jgi:hypothetical protein
MLPNGFGTCFVQVISHAKRFSCLFCAGYVLKSIYTFNPITCLDYSYSAHLLVTTSGMLEQNCWNLMVQKTQILFPDRSADPAQSGQFIVDVVCLVTDHSMVLYWRFESMNQNWIFFFQMVGR